MVSAKCKYMHGASRKRKFCYKEMYITVIDHDNFAS